MPKVRTYYSQVQSNALTGGAQATDIRALTDDGKQALYGAAADLGNFGMQLGLKEMAFNDSISQAKAVQIMRNAELDYQTKIAKDPDTNNWSKYHKEVVQNAQAEIKKLKFGTNKGQKQNDIEVSTWNGIFTKSAQVKMIKQKSRDALAVAEAVYEAESEYDDGTPDSAVKINAARNAYQEALKNSYSPEVANAKLKLADMQASMIKAKAAEERLINLTFERAIAAGDKKAGYDFIDKQNLTADQRRIIGNKIDDYWEGRSKEERKSILDNTLSFSDKLISGNFNSDDIITSNLPKPAQDVWMKRLDGSREAPPEDSSWDGINNVTKIITQYSSGKLGEIEALGQLADARYVNKSITDSMYKLAVNRIKNPYPQHVSETINGVLKAAQDELDEKGWAFGFDWIDSGEKRAYINKSTSFLNWIEEESKDGKYPDGKAMYVKMNELGVAIETPANLPKAKRIIPNKTDSTYVTTDEARDNLASGTEYYDAVMGVWRRKK
jgi:hypothetical protein